MSEKRSSFTGKLGFVLAAAGSAVGLGNIWRFPYLAAKYGGGIFLLVYIILAVTLGFTLVTAEIALGRKTGKSPIDAFSSLNKKYSFIGWIATLIPVIILPYYSVIGGWVTKFLFGYVSGNGEAMGAATDSTPYFLNYISSTDKAVVPVLWFIAFLAVTAIIVILGVNKGVEKVSKLMMPVLIILTIFIAVYVICSMDGAAEGVKYYLLPDFSNFSAMTVVAAMGQLFYSMSIAMGIMITFGSYMKKDINIESSVHQVELFDTGVAFLAGLMIIPAVFAIGGDVNAGPGLMFITLPEIFNKMPGGHIIGATFFLMVLFAALTSSISLMETISSVFQDKFKMKRIPSVLLIFGISVVLGIVSAFGFSIWSGITPLGMDLLTFFDFISNSIMMPICAFLTCVFIVFVIKTKTITDEIELNGKFKSKKMFEIIIKYIAPVCILAILVFSILDGFGILKI